MTQARERFERLNKPTRIAVLILLSVVGLLLLTYAVAFSVAYNPNVCGACHQIAPAYKTWKDTAHERFTCANCHATAGYGKRFVAAFDLTRYFYRHITGSYARPVHVSGAIKNDICLQCHVSWREVSPAGDLIVPHERHFVELETPCNTCHSRVAHGYDLRGEFTTRPSMERCLRCHDDEKAPRECKRCHTEKPIPDNHKVAGWFEGHGELDIGQGGEVDCGECHGWVLDFCRECHEESRPSTHVGEEQWRSLHRDRALLKPKTCLICHDRTYCLRCHDEGLFVDRLEGKLGED